MNNVDKNCNYVITFFFAAAIVTVDLLERLALCIWNAFIIVMPRNTHAIILINNTFAIIYEICLLLLNNQIWNFDALNYNFLFMLYV